MSQTIHIFFIQKRQKYHLTNQEYPDMKRLIRSRDCIVKADTYNLEFIIVIRTTWKYVNGNNKVACLGLYLDLTHAEVT